MQLIPHVDVADEATIESLLATPGNHSWPAMDSESMDGWVPDLGLTAYANYSIYRPPSIVAAGIESSVRHRFRVPPRNPRLPGTYYLGALVYDEVGFEFPLELSLGSEDVGRIEASRHDNRRHLLVIERPIVFDARVKWVQFTSDGGPCRIERFVMLTELPVAASLAPQIERLHVEPDRRSDGTVGGATVHCVTYPPSTLTVAVDGQPVEAPAGATTLHAVGLPAVAERRGHTVQVVATEPAGATAEAGCEFQLDGSEPSARGLRSVEADVELCCLSSVPLAGMPLAFGVPIARGQLTSASTGRLVWGDDDSEEPVQARAHSTWPDGSVRWALLEGAVPEGLQPGGRLPCRVSVAPMGSADEPSSASVLPGLSAERSDDGVVVSGSRLRVSVRPEGADWLTIERVPAAAAGPGDTLGGGTLQQALHLELASGSHLELVAGTAELEHPGPQRATVRLEIAHRDAAGLERLRSQLRLHVFADQPFIKLVHRLLVVRADPDHEGPFETGAAEERALLAVRSCSLRLPFPVAAVRMEGERYQIGPGRPFAVHHHHDLAHTVVGEGNHQRHEGHTAAHLLVEAGAGRAAVVGMRGFWQNYPKGISASTDGIQLEIMPPRPAEELPGDDDAWHRLYRWLPDDTYLLREGMAPSTEMCLGVVFSDEAGEATASAALAWLEAPVVARPDVEYTNRTGALPPLSPKATSARPGYERMTEEALRLLHENRDECRAYGHVNFGDWYGEGDWSWGNNEYDTPYVAYWEFLRGGDPAWTAWGAQAARHLADIDTVNTFHDERHIGMQQMHTPAHLAGYLPPYFLSKIPGTRGIPSHMWAEGPLLHYLMTGDEGVRDSLHRTSGWLVQAERLDHYDFTAVREAGWHLIHLTMLAAATNDRRALNGAAIVVKRILEKQDESGGWTRMLTSGHCQCGFPHCRGNIAFMVTVLLSALKRYHDLTGEHGLVDAIVAGGRWLVRETFKEQSGQFIGGSCRTMQQLGEGSPFSTQIIIEGIADAYAVSGDAEIRRCLDRVLPVVDLLPELDGSRDLGKRISSHMRYVPTVLAALESQPND